MINIKRAHSMLWTWGQAEELIREKLESVAELEALLAMDCAREADGRPRATAARSSMPYDAVGIEAIASDKLMEDIARLRRSIGNIIGARRKVDQFLAGRSLRERRLARMRYRQRLPWKACAAVERVSESRAREIGRALRDALAEALN